MSAAGWSQVADDVRRFERVAAGEAIDRVAEAIRARLRADTGDGSLSHGRALGAASVDVTKGVGEAEVSAGGSRRVWGIIEGGTSGHRVDAGPGHALNTPYGPRRSVQVSGVAPRRTFTESCAAGMEEAAKALEDSWGRVAG